jgi:hypothetical protein
VEAAALRAPLLCKSPLHQKERRRRIAWEEGVRTRKSDWAESCVLQNTGGRITNYVQVTHERAVAHPHYYKLHAT